jgi:uncharacterized membrane protein
MFALPDPLHPAIVHFPVALALLSPFVALAAVLALTRGWLPARAWVGVVLLQALLAGSAWAALETGEDQHERVEKIVGNEPLETHQDAAERLLAIAVAGLVVSAAGLLSGSAGRYGRMASVASNAVILVAALAVGHSGGELVYKYGAAQAYMKTAAGGGALSGAGIGAPETGRPVRADDDD